MKKIFKHSKIYAAIVVGLMASTSAAQAAQDYSFQDWVVAPPAANSSGDNNTILGINNNGDKVGLFSAGGSNTQFGFYNHTTINYSLGAGNYDTTFTGINNSGQAIGTYSDPATGAFGFVQSGAAGAKTVISDTSAAHGATGNHTAVTGINDSGIVVGSYNTIQGDFNFQYNTANNTYTDITTLGAGVVSGINNSGWLIGNDTTQGYVFNGTTLTSINDPLATGGPGAYTRVNGINNLGEVVGSWQDSNYVMGSFTYDAVKNVFIDTNIKVPANTNGYVFTAINDLGQLGGTYNPLAGGGIGFIATPVSAVPLPGAVWLFGSMLMAGLFSDKRRKALFAA
jgi:hypothetical protein